MNDQIDLDDIDGVIQVIIEGVTPVAFLLENKEHTRSMAVERLQQIGLSVVAGSSPQQALEDIARLKPSIVVTDYSLEGEHDNGIDLISKLQGSGDRLSPSTVVWTEHPNDAQHEAKQRGVLIDVLLKKDQILKTTVEELRTLFFDILRNQIRKQIELRLRPLFERMRQYRDLVGDIESVTLVDQFRCQVLDLDVPTDPFGARVEVTFQDGTKEIRVFPKQRLNHEGAAFEAALLEYSAYQNGAVNITRLKYSGPRKDELIKTIPTINPQRLEEMDARRTKT